MTTELLDIQSARRILLDVILDGNIPEDSDYDEEYQTIEGARRYLRNREAELRGETLDQLMMRELHEALSKLKGFEVISPLCYCQDCGEPAHAIVCPRCIEERRLAR